MAERPLQTLKIAPPWRMLLVGKDVEIIVTGLNKERVNQVMGMLIEHVGIELYPTHELADGASFEDLQRLKQL